MFSLMNLEVKQQNNKECLTYWFQHFFFLIKKF